MTELTAQRSRLLQGQAQRMLPGSEIVCCTYRSDEDSLVLGFHVGVIGYVHLSRAVLLLEGGVV